jgi:hypothetical protein
VACSLCGTRVLRSGGAPPTYDGDYCEGRHHHDPEVGACKRLSLARWLDRLSIRVESEVTCEVGFGGGWCLASIHERGGFVMGLEPIAANREHAASLGIPAERLFDATPLPSLPAKPTLWLFQDSLEHVDDPAALVRWIASESSPVRTRVLVVAPDARSASRRVMGPFWPHHTPDHRIHYTAMGIEALFAPAGFVKAAAFRPAKCVSARMVASHAALLWPALGRLRRARPPAWRIWFHLGELGLLLERHADRAKAAP